MGASALEKAREKWKKDQARNQEMMVKIAEEKAKKAKKEPKVKPVASKRTTAAKKKEEPVITDMKSHLRTVTVPKYSTVPLAKQIKDCLDSLQSAQEPLSPAQLEERTGHACEPDSQLAEQLAKNPKIAYSNGQFRFKSASEVKVHDRAGALQFIQSSHGCLLRDLTAIYPNAAEDVAKMKAEGLVYTLPAAEKEQQVLFASDQPAIIQVSDKLITAWLDVQMPEDADEELKEMKKAGLQSAVQRGKRERLRPAKKEKEKKKRPTNFSRFTKITNAHLPQLFQGDAASID